MTNPAVAPDPVATDAPASGRRVAPALRHDASVIGLTVDDVSVVLVGNSPVVVPLPKQVAAAAGFEVVEVDESILFSIGVLPVGGSAAEPAPAAPEPPARHLAPEPGPAAAAPAPAPAFAVPEEPVPLAGPTSAPPRTVGAGEAVVAADALAAGAQALADLGPAPTAEPVQVQLAVDANQVAGPRPLLDKLARPAPVLAPPSTPVAEPVGFRKLEDGPLVDDVFRLEQVSDASEPARPYAVGGAARADGGRLSPAATWPDVERRVNDRSTTTEADRSGAGAPEIVARVMVPGVVEGGFTAVTPPATPPVVEAELVAEVEPVVEVAPALEVPVAGPPPAPAPVWPAADTAATPAFPFLAVADPVPVDVPHGAADDALAALGIPTDEVPADEVPAFDVPAVDVPAFEVPAFEVPAFDVPAFEIPAEDVPAFEVPALEVPAFDVPAFELPDAELPAFEIPAEDVPAFEIPAEDVPAFDVPAFEIPAEDVPAFDVPAFEIPAEDVPAFDVPAFELPDAELPAFDLPADAVPAFDVPTVEVPTSDAFAPPLAPAPDDVLDEVDGVVLAARGVRRHTAGDRSIEIDDLVLRAGEILVVQGGEGSGKTCFARLLAGFDAPDEGSLVIVGTETATLPAEDRAVREGASLGFASAFPSLVPDLTVVENTELALLVQDEDADTARAAAAAELAALGVESLADRRAETLARSEAVRVGLARALTGEPALVVVDDCTLGLGAETVSDLLYRLLVVAFDGASVVVTTTDPRVWHALVTERGARAGELVDGRLVLD